MSSRSGTKAALRWVQHLRHIHSTSTPHASRTVPSTFPYKEISAILFATAAAITSPWAVAIAAPDKEPSSQPPSKNDGTAQWRVFTDIARDLSREGRRDEAEPYLKRALVAAKLGFGETDPHVASACQNLAEMYRLQKKYDLAGPLYDQALAILGETYGPKDIRVAFALHNVAGYYFAQRDWDRASQYYEQALQVKLGSVGPGHMETSNTIFHLAEVRWAQGRKKEAIQYAQQCLDAMEQQMASEAACSRRRSRLGEMLMEDGQYAAAVPLFKKVLTETAMEEGVGRVRAVENLARALKGAGEYQQAKQLFEESVEMRRERDGGGEHHPATAAALRRLAEVHLALLLQAPSNSSENSGSRPGDVAGEQLEMLELAQEAVDVGQRAMAAAVENSSVLLLQRRRRREKQAESEAENSSSNSSGNEGILEEKQQKKKGLFEKLFSAATPTTTTEQQKQLQQLPRVSRAARPDIAALELSSCLLTLARVQHALGASYQTLDAVLLRALHVVTADWPLLGDQQQHQCAEGVSTYSTKVEELRRGVVCSVLKERLETEVEFQRQCAEEGGGDGSGDDDAGLKAKELMELMKMYSCDDERCEDGNENRKKKKKKGRGWWR